MVIREDLLLSVGADIITLNQSDRLFGEDTPPEYYFQIMEGQVKLINFKTGDREFVQSIHNKGDSIGEVFLFCKHHRYPATAIATKESKILRLQHSGFVKLLESDFDLQLTFLRGCAQRTYFSYVFLNSLTSEDATHQLLTVLNHLKEEQNLTGNYSYKVLYSRKELSSLTGLRTETVIRLLKKLESEKVVQIVKGKVYY